MDHQRGNEYVAVIGLGYVGLPLAASLAAAGTPVVGVEASPAIRELVRAGRPPGHEPGVEELLRSLPAGALTVAAGLPDQPPAAVVICVGTAVDARSRRPDLRDLASAVAQVTPRIGPDTLVVVRSTVPVGTCRTLVLPALAGRLTEPLLAFCPERTIQGRALAELRALPQVIGGLDDRSAERAGALLAPVATDQVRVSSLEAAEAVKLICNAHTDLLYGFGNEVALIADSLGLDAYELIEAANLRYPRPDLSRPGFVGGSCLSKDPFLLAYSAESAGHRPRLVVAAREVNESLPPYAVDRVMKALVTRRPAAEAKVCVAGIAYKGQPETDDVRGSAAQEVARLLSGRVGELTGHDFVVPADRIAALGYRPVDLAAGLRDADVLILLTNHPGYRTLDADRIRATMRPTPVVFDMWSILHDRLAGLPDVQYMGVGRG